MHRAVFYKKEKHMPFSESESMTIKRLEVALRKMDLQLLKDGAYKLHEKFHSGHRFEYINELRQIYEFVQARENIPPEISNILKSTIEEIIKKDEEDRSWENAGVQEVEYDNLNKLDDIISRLDDPIPQTPQNKIDSQKPVSPIQTTPQRNPVPPPPVPGEQLTQKPAEQVQPVQQSLLHQEQSSLSDKIQVSNEANNEINIDTAQIDNLPDIHHAAHPAPQNEPPVNEYASYEQTESNVRDEQSAETQDAFVGHSAEEFLGDDFTQEVFQDSEYTEECQEERSEGGTDSSPSEIALFYDDAQADIDFSIIKDYRNQLNMLFSKNQSCDEFKLLREISNISNIIDTPIDDVDRIISTLTTTKNKTSFLTTSQSQNFTKMFVRGNLDFEIPFVKKARNPEKAYTIIPMLGFSNIFVCSNCNARNLKTDFNTKTLSVQCPDCDGACFPDLYAVNSYNPDCNPIFWHRSFATFVKAKTWVLVNPPLDENKEVIFDFLKTAYDASAPKRVYLLSRENDKREFYKQTFSTINPNCDLRCDYSTQEKLCEDFINTEIMLKVIS